MTEQPERLPLEIRLTLDQFGDPYCTLALPPPRDGEPYMMTPETLEEVAKTLMAAAATARLRAAMFRTLIGQGKDPAEALQFVLDHTG